MEIKIFGRKRIWLLKPASFPPEMGPDPYKSVLRFGTSPQFGFEKIEEQRAETVGFDQPAVYFIEKRPLPARTSEDWRANFEHSIFLISAFRRLAAGRRRG